MTQRTRLKSQMQAFGIVRLARSFGRLVDRRARISFGLVGIASLMTSALDAVALLLLMPLIQALSNGDEVMHVPLLGTSSLTSYLVVTVILFMAKTASTAIIKWHPPQ